MTLEFEGEQPNEIVYVPVGPDGSPVYARQLT